MLKEKYGYSKLFMIGDGITDLEASPPADAFIGKFPSYFFSKYKKMDKYTINYFPCLILFFPTYIMIILLSQFVDSSIFLNYYV